MRTLKKMWSRSAKSSVQGGRNDKLGGTGESLSSKAMGVAAQPIREESESPRPSGAAANKPEDASTAAPSSRQLAGGSADASSLPAGASAAMMAAASPLQASGGTQRRGSGDSTGRQRRGSGDKPAVAETLAVGAAATSTLRTVASPSPPPAQAIPGLQQAASQAAAKELHEAVAPGRQQEQKEQQEEGAEDEQGQSARDAAWERLPVQLQQLPPERWEALSQGLAVLEQAGLGKVQSVRELHSAAVNALADDDVTDYTFMCNWARTPDLWRKAVGKVDPSEHCSLWGKSEKEAEALRSALAQQQRQQQQRTLEEASAAGQAKAMKHVRRRVEKSAIRKRFREQEDFDHEAAEAHFELWWAAMLAAEADICSLESCTLATLGEGPGALFSEQQQSWQLPPVKAKIRAPTLAPEPAAPKIKLTPLEREGVTVFFMKAGKGVFGKVPSPPKPPKPEVSPVVEAPKALTLNPPAVITLHLGGGGCGVGVAAWRRLFVEHGLGADGRPQGDGLLLPGAAVHFAESSRGRHVPHAVFADCDATGLSGALADRWFSPADVLEGAPDNRGDWVSLAQGPLVEDVAEAVRVHMEQADSVRCVVLTHSLQGAAGGGLASGLARKMGEENRKLLLWSLALAPLGVAETGAYNTLLSLSALRSTCSLLTFADAPHDDLARVLAAFTSPLRAHANASEGWSDLRPDKAACHLVAYPHANCTFACLAALQPGEPQGDAVVRCLSQGQLLALPAQGKPLATALYCRGVAHSSALEALRTRRGQGGFGFAVGGQLELPPQSREVVALQSHTAVMTAVPAKWAQVFDQWWRDRHDMESAEGLENEGELHEAREDLEAFMAGGRELERAEEENNEEE